MAEKDFLSEVDIESIAKVMEEGLQVEKLLRQAYLLNGDIHNFIKADHRINQARLLIIELRSRL